MSGIVFLFVSPAWVPVRSGEIETSLKVMSFLSYVEGAIHGKTLKRKASDEDKKAKCRKYEKNHMRSLNPKLRDGRTWLMHDTEENVMTGTVCRKGKAQNNDCQFFSVWKLFFYYQLECPVKVKTPWETLQYQ